MNVAEKALSVIHVVHVVELVTQRERAAGAKREVIRAVAEIARFAVRAFCVKSRRKELTREGRERRTAVHRKKTVREVDFVGLHSARSESEGAALRTDEAADDERVVPRDVHREGTRRVEGIGVERAARNIGVAACGQEGRRRDRAAGDRERAGIDRNVVDGDCTGVARKRQHTGIHRRGGEVVLTTVERDFRHGFVVVRIVGENEVLDGNGVFEVGLNPAGAAEQMHVPVEDNLAAVDFQRVRSGVFRGIEICAVVEDEITALHRSGEGEQSVAVESDLGAFYEFHAAVAVEIERAVVDDDASEIDDRAVDMAVSVVIAVQHEGRTARVNFDTFFDTEEPGRDFCILKRELLRSFDGERVHAQGGVLNGKVAAFGVEREARIFRSQRPAFDRHVAAEEFAVRRIKGG